IERHSPANGRHSCRGKALKEPPASENLGAMGPQDMCRNRVAWEGRPVNEQYPKSAACEQHGGWRASTPRADDNGVVHRDLRVDRHYPTRKGSSSDGIPKNRDRLKLGISVYVSQ